MHRNILLGITAWLLGAATATAGCLLAVSLLGSGITTGSSGRLLSQDAANRELASEAAKGAPGETPAPATSTDPEPTLASVAPTRVRSSASATSATTPGPPKAGATGSGDAVAASTAPSESAAAPSESAAAPSGSAAAPSASATAPSASAAAPSASPSAGTVLASSAGTVVATCQAAGAYLISWSPAQGYEVGDVSRGPAATASVHFESTTNEVTMLVTCSAGVPSATTSTGGGGVDE